MKIETIGYVQEMHSCGPSLEDAKAVFTIHNGGVGDYLVLDASLWSFDNAKEIDEFAAAMKKLLVEGK